MSLADSYNGRIGPGVAVPVTAGGARAATRPGWRMPSRGVDETPRPGTHKKPEMLLQNRRFFAVFPAPLLVRTRSVVGGRCAAIGCKPRESVVDNKTKTQGQPHKLQPHCAKPRAPAG